MLGVAVAVRSVKRRRRGKSLSGNALPRNASRSRQVPGKWAYRTLAFLAVQNGESRGRRFRSVGRSAFGGGSGSSSSGSPSSILWGTANTKRFSTL
jgi:hypothetical protein